MVSISENKCVGCGICVTGCLANAISINGSGFAVIDRDKCVNCGACIKNCPQNAVREIKEVILFAIGTDDGKTIKSGDHVGMSKFYQIWKYLDGKLIFKEKRENIKYEENESEVHGDPQKAEKVASVLKGVSVIVGKMFGPNIIRLKNKFVPVVIREPNIKKAVKIIEENINEIIEEKNKKEKTGLVLN